MQMSRSMYDVDVRCMYDDVMSWWCSLSFTMLWLSKTKGTIQHNPIMKAHHSGSYCDLHSMTQWLLCWCSQSKDTFQAHSFWMNWSTILIQFIQRASKEGFLVVVIFLFFSVTPCILSLNLSAALKYAKRMRWQGNYIQNTFYTFE